MVTYNGVYVNGVYVNRSRWNFHQLRVREETPGGEEEGRLTHALDETGVDRD